MSGAARTPRRGRAAPRTAVVIVGTVNALDFPGGRALLRSALACAERIAQLKARAADPGLLVIYANDNDGQ